jgi:methylmalonyl-CoA/ethylmalonyl-CoA epimerase
MSERLGSMHHVGIVVRDLDQAEAFVTGALGLPVVNRLASPERGMRAVFFDCGPATIELLEFADVDLVRDRIGDRMAAIDHIALRVADLDSAVQALAGHGVDTVEAVPTTLPSGRMHFTRADTSAGITWQLLEGAAAPPSGDSVTAKVGSNT